MRVARVIVSSLVLAAGACTTSSSTSLSPDSGTPATPDASRAADSADRPTPGDAPADTPVSPSPDGGNSNSPDVSLAVDSADRPTSGDGSADAAISPTPDGRNPDSTDASRAADAADVPTPGDGSADAAVSPTPDGRNPDSTDTSRAADSADSRAGLINGVCIDEKAVAGFDCPPKAPASDQELLAICQTMNGPSRPDREAYVVECYPVIHSPACDRNPPDRPAFCDGPADPTTITVQITGWLGDQACIYNRTSGDLVARLISNDTPSYCDGTSFNAVSGQVSPAPCVRSSPYLRHVSCIYRADAGI